MPLGVPFLHLQLNIKCLKQNKHTFIPLATKDVKPEAIHEVQEKHEENGNDDDRGSANGEPENVRTTGKFCSC